MFDRARVRYILPFVLLVSLACGLPVAARTGTPPPTATISAATAEPSTDQGAVPADPGTPTPPPLVATIMASQHEQEPSEPGPAGRLNYDVDSSGTGPEHRAPYGDSYDINLFERPFTQTDMNYLQPLDIVTFRLAEDASWYYVSVDLVGGDPNDELAINYGIELDIDHDGFGDYLVWGYPPYTTEWLAETVQVYRDTNHDTGGASAEKSDAVYPGNGYDELVFDRGQGDDPDLAWVRANPQVSSAVQFAFKRSLAGNAFMWGAWADAGLRDPAQFNYNDRYKEQDAGSPEKSEKYYPINAISQTDDTCWAAQGFHPTGYEAHLCPSLEPQPTKQKAPPTPQDPACTSILDCYQWNFPFIIPPKPPVP